MKFSGYAKQRKALKKLLHIWVNGIVEWIHSKNIKIIENLNGYILNYISNTYEYR